MFKRILVAVILVAALGFAALFTWLNPGELSLDLGFTDLSAPVGLLLVAVLAIGWLIGLLSASIWVARISADRRRLRSELRSAATASGLAVRDERG